MNNPQPWWLTWPVAEVAAAILPWFASSPPEYEGFAMKRIVRWMMTGSAGDRRGASFRASEPFDNPDVRAVAEAIQVLEHSRLLMRSPGDQAHVGLTRLGMHALQTNTVRQHLGLSDAPPMT
jgi:hypothetical protein